MQRCDNWCALRRAPARKVPLSFSSGLLVTLVVFLLNSSSASSSSGRRLSPPSHPNREQDSNFLAGLAASPANASPPFQRLLSFVDPFHFPSSSPSSSRVWAPLSAAPPSSSTASAAQSSSASSARSALSVSARSASSASSPSRVDPPPSQPGSLTVSPARPSAPDASSSEDEAPAAAFFSSAGASPGATFLSASSAAAAARRLSQGADVAQSPADRSGRGFHLSEEELLQGMKKDIFFILHHGSMPYGYPTYREASLMMNELLKEFGPSLVTAHRIGHSLEGRPITAYRVGGLSRPCWRVPSKGAETPSSSPETATAEKKKTEEREEFPEILLTGLHHAREPMSMTMCMYFVARLLRDYQAGEPEAAYLMEMREFWVIPALNPDAYVAIERTGNVNLRKNRRRFSPHARPRGAKPEDEGVDLNRNYAFNFNPNEPEGSDEYGGLFPFSEPETAAVKFLVEQYLRASPSSPPRSPSSPGGILASAAVAGAEGADFSPPTPSPFFDRLGRFEVALNFHTYGEVWTRPFNCCKDLPLPPRARKAFEEIQAALAIPILDSAPNIAVLGYPTNGEADDWLLHAHGVLSTSPEIGWEEGGFWQTQGDWTAIFEANFARVATTGFKAGSELGVIIVRHEADADANPAEPRKREAGEGREDEGRSDLGSLIPKESLAFVEDALRKAGWNPASAHEVPVPHAVQGEFAIYSVEISNTGLLPMQGSSAFLFLTGLPFFASSSAASLSPFPAELFSSVRAAAEASLPVIRSPLEPRFTGSRSKFSLPPAQELRSLQEFKSRRRQTPPPSPPLSPLSSSSLLSFSSLGGDPSGAVQARAAAEEEFTLAAAFDGAWSEALVVSVLSPAAFLREGRDDVGVPGVLVKLPEPLRGRDLTTGEAAFLRLHLLFRKRKPAGSRSARSSGASAFHASERPAFHEREEAAAGACVLEAAPRPPEAAAASAARGASSSRRSWFCRCGATKIAKTSQENSETPAAGADAHPWTLLPLFVEDRKSSVLCFTALGMLSSHLEASVSSSRVSSSSAASVSSLAGKERQEERRLRGEKGYPELETPLFYANRKSFVTFALLMLLSLVLVLILALRLWAKARGLRGAVHECAEDFRLGEAADWLRSQIGFLCCCLQMIFARRRPPGVEPILIDTHAYGSPSRRRRRRHSRQPRAELEAGIFSNRKKREAGALPAVAGRKPGAR
ncbi:zinc carboxypeptidase superfamily protein [Besnoitia besnoiti]|uniref:Zinc carboxypeptidase superfamily protein n=1 Tax=Besnoitia besnoiti TaxID=94643 RepID=A0A2A9MMJ0_BESBE|nr:zinc carboxypeptidase superfamily protein [Besnoitia besnoiti]PFH37326.1 zinc carboxypeptidase superfamily protein [Besnoitia besnoiti]